jgi:hypothetical protein
MRLLSTNSREAFFRGMAQAFDLSGSISIRRLRRFRARSRATALAANWSKVSRDFGRVMQRHAAGHGT